MDARRIGIEAEDVAVVRRCNCERWASLSAVPWVLRTFLKPAWWGIITSM